MPADPSSSSSGRPPTRSPAALAALAQLNMGRVLRPLVMLATGISVFFHLRQFLSGAFILRYNPDLAYVTLLAAYAGHKEVRRWVQDPEVIVERARRGEVFVIFWWLFYYVTLVAANQIAAYQVPDGLLVLSIEVTTIFFGTLASRQFYQRRQGRPTVILSLEDRILERLGQANEPVKSGELEAQFGVSRSTLYRALRSLEARGQAEWVGRSETDPEGGFRRRK